MARKIFVSALVVLATLVIVPSVLATLRSPSAFGSSSTHGTVVSGGWASPLPMDAKRLRIGASISQSLTIANEGSLSADYRLRARVIGDSRLAAQLSIVATRLADEATIFSGPVARLASVDLGRFVAGQHETLRLRLTLRSTGNDARDSVLQGRGMSVGFTWTATQASQ